MAERQIPQPQFKIPTRRGRSVAYPTAPVGGRRSLQVAGAGEAGKLEAAQIEGRAFGQISGTIGKIIEIRNQQKERDDKLNLMSKEVEFDRRMNEFLANEKQKQGKDSFVSPDLVAEYGAQLTEELSGGNNFADSDKFWGIKGSYKTVQAQKEISGHVLKERVKYEQAVVGETVDNLTSKSTQITLDDPDAFSKLNNYIELAVNAEMVINTMDDAEIEIATREISNRMIGSFILANIETNPNRTVDWWDANKDVVRARTDTKVFLTLGQKIEALRPAKEVTEAVDTMKAQIPDEIRDNHDKMIDWYNSAIESVRDGEFDNLDARQRTTVMSILRQEKNDIVSQRAEMKDRMEADATRRIYKMLGDAENKNRYKDAMADIQRSVHSGVIGGTLAKQLQNMVMSDKALKYDPIIESQVREQIFAGLINSESDIWSHPDLSNTGGVKERLVRLLKAQEEARGRTNFVRETMKYTLMKKLNNKDVSYAEKIDIVRKMADIYRAVDDAGLTPYDQKSLDVIKKELEQDSGALKALYNWIAESFKVIGKEFGKDVNKLVFPKKVDETPKQEPKDEVMVVKQMIANAGGNTDDAQLIRDTLVENGKALTAKNVTTLLTYFLSKKRGNGQAGSK